MTQRYDICSGRKDGSGKTQWVKIGVMFPAKEKEGFSIKFDALPLPDERGQVWVSAFPPRDGATRGSMRPDPDRPVDDSDIPF